jgi:hypothetical protein
MISAQVAIRAIGIDNLSSQVIVAFLVIVCGWFIVLQYKNRFKGFGIKYNMTVAILMAITCFLAGVMVIIFKGSPGLIDKYGGFILLCGLSSFFALTLYMVIYRIIYETKHK